MLALDAAGTFELNKRLGRGEEIYANGTKLVGLFDNDVMTTGAFFDRNGRMLENYMDKAP